MLKPPDDNGDQKRAFGAVGKHGFQNTLKQAIHHGVIDVRLSSQQRHSKSKLLTTFNSL